MASVTIKLRRTRLLSRVCRRKPRIIRRARKMDETRLSLLERVRDPSDHLAWVEFDHIYRPLLERFARKRGVRPGDVDDLVQDVLIKLSKHLTAFQLDKDRGRFRTFLWTVICRDSVSWFRKNRRLNNQVEFDERIADIESISMVDPDAEFAADVQKRTLLLALADVKNTSNTQTWDCFELHKQKGLRAEEVAAKLNCGISAVYVNAKRILNRIKKKCEDYSEPINREC